MRKDYDSFINSIESKNTAKIAKSLNVIGEYDYTNVTPIDIDAVVLETKPNSQKDITTVLYIMSLYAKHIGNDDFYYMARSADRRAIWLKAKPNAVKKFISHEEYVNAISSIRTKEEHNILYHQTLFACVYEGIYSDDMSVIKNLRASDIIGNIVTLRYDNGETHDIEISSELAENLKELSTIEHWWRNNRYGSYKIDIAGQHKDSCFKAESRNGTDDYSYRYAYYRVLRKISKEHIERKILPLQLYISGAMYRICKELKENGMGIQDAFAENSKNRLVGKIISDELKRMNYHIEVRNFREIVNGHLDIFDC